ncbi:MAG: chemotaxis protein CheW [Chitinispirillales bacterium]|jgi:purine-binding chemotaxis protein CheW|nr:chemotaxis protein CheW [Chitinispirillales bacterium]
MAGVAEAHAVNLAGKYLTFRLVDEEYGLEILKVREIIGLLPITCLPRTPPFVRGVINLRGKVIPVIDLRKKFELDVTDDTDQTCIIVVDVTGESGTIQVGILVDSVSEVLDIRGEDIEEAPAFGASVDTAFILGMAKAKGGVKILLNIEKVLSPSDLESFKYRKGDERRQGAETINHDDRRDGSDRRSDDMDM